MAKLVYASHSKCDNYCFEGSSPSLPIYIILDLTIMSLLILGSTGTLGRQIVRKALNEGFHVKCFVRNFRKAAFLKQWGAELIYGDLQLSDTIPGTLQGITAIIDASTARTNELHLSKTIDLTNKQILIRAAQLANIKRYIFFSIFNAKNYQEISIMHFKFQIEEYLKKSELNYTIFSVCGFFQGLIRQYALPILDKQSIWITQESQAIPYIDTQDVAKFAIKSLSIVNAKNKKFVLTGKHAWTSFEIIKLCEKLSGQKSKISSISILSLQLLRQVTLMFQWTWNISERLAFTNILLQTNYYTEPIDDFYDIFQVQSTDLNSLENYLQEYFYNILRRMKELNEQDQDLTPLDIF